MTPRAYRQQLRLDRARWMIEHTDLSVTAVGLECGFGDCSHFSRAFMAHFSQPASTMRRQSRANRRAKA
jgi:transcriptional regulator GlxA family with amidase domain